MMRHTMKSSARLVGSAGAKQTRAASITAVHGREVIDSRGNPTVEVDVTTTDGMFRASVPSGASTGIYEAMELRDGGSRYCGKGVLGACAAVNDTIGPALVGMDPVEQTAIDDKMNAMDGTHNKAKLGANAILGVSLAAAKAGAGAKGVQLYQHMGDLAGCSTFEMPTPCFNVINGGEHAGNKLAFQEYFVVPTGAASFGEAMAIGCEVYHALSTVISGKFGGDATLIGDEGGFAPPCSNEEGAQLLMEAIEKVGYLDKCKLGLDVAASEFLTEDGMYDLEKNGPGHKVSPAELADFYKTLVDKYPIVTIEDPFDQDDWEGWSQITADLGNEVQIVGDDLLVTNVERIITAKEKKACNALLLKVNQIGSVTESINAVKMSKQAGWGVMTSHRSGETEDNYIADMAVGLCSGQIKTGAPCRGERTAKYNQLLRIEEELAGSAAYSGAAFRTPSWMA